MRKIINMLAVWSALFLMVAVSYESGDSYCVIFPQNGRDIFGVAQRTILVFGEGEVSLIPQVHFEGDARDFGILVPVPAEPSLSTVGSNIFTEASFMTQPIIRQSTSGGGCDDNNQIVGPPFLSRFAEGDLVQDAASGVTVISEEIVGMFQAAILQATNADDLTKWLNENNYKFDPADAQVLADYITKNWFFVAMKLDPSQVPPLINQWWAATTSPAKITFDYSNTSLTYPLKISAISTNERAEVLVYSIGKDPMRFPGAKVEYANEIDETEAESIALQYPTMANYIPPGVFVTKLRRTFTKSEMQQDIEIETTEDRREFREIRYVNNSGFGWAGILILAIVLFLNRRKKTNAT
ncbi:DUF2330 domain-containing protein [candidate division KSB1 bacterium]|nr:DUF2330 domain-containing protein [candidate division KSB1 bacterium]